MKKFFCLLLLSLTSLTGAESSTSAYPLDTCLVSGEKLGSMGEPVVIQYQGREVRFCCEHCQPKFEKAPAEFLKKLDQAGRNGN